MSGYCSRRAMRAAAALAGVLVVSLIAPGQAAATGAPRLEWTPCFADVGPFECATADVPLDYDRPREATISVALTRLPATDPQRRIGSLFLNPGGPGGSGVDFVVGAGPFLYTDEVRARFDLVGFDPRGIYRSTGLQCFDSPDEWGPWFIPLAFPITREEERLWIAADRFLTSACEGRAGPIIDHMSTANVARDLDVLREAVGDPKLTYAGYSYGSYLGNTYANMFPQRVRAVVLDGVLDPIAWSTGRSRLEGATVPFSTRLRSDAGAQATLDEFFRLCDAAGDACAFSGNAAGRFAALARHLLREPVEITFPDGTTALLNYSLFIGATLGAMYDSPSWSEFAQLLADIEAEAAAPAKLAARLEQFAERPGYQADDLYPNDLEGFPGVACSDSDNPHDYRAWSINGALADARFGYFGRLWTWVSSICAEWPGFDRDRYAGPFDRTTANPVLVVGNHFDPATRYEGAVLVDHLLPRSALLSVHGWGHVSLFLSQCADATVSRYLLTVATPPPGTTCEQDVMPFTQSRAPEDAARAGLRRLSPAARGG
jgi:pimeloyl-ACP methyl ester carboxylesterase